MRPTDAGRWVLSPRKQPQTPKTASAIIAETALERSPHAPPIPYRLILACIWLTFASVGVILLGIKLKTLLFHIVLAIFIALVLSPAIERLARTRLSRGASIAVIIAAVVIAAAGIGATVATPLASSGIKFARNAPEYLREAAVGKGPLARTAARFHLQKQLAKSVPSISKALSHVSSDVLTLGRRVASAAFNAAIVLILAIFMLVEGPRMMANAIVAMPEGRREAARRIGRRIARVVSGYTTGVLLMAALNGLVTVAALTATGTPFVIPLAIWAAVVDILPIVGGLLGIVPAGLFALGKSLPAGIIVIVAMFLYQQVKNHLLYPVLVGRAVQMNSLLVLVAVLVGADLGHVSGAILAIPVAGTLQTFLIEFARERAGLPPSQGAEKPPVPDAPHHSVWELLNPLRSHRRSSTTPHPELPAEEAEPPATPTKGPRRRRKSG